jgi:hypothetical protein
VFKSPLPQIRGTNQEHQYYGSFPITGYPQITLLKPNIGTIIN